MAQVRITKEFLADDKLMMKVIDSGYNLTNKKPCELSGCFKFDIAGPDIPEGYTGMVDIWTNDITGKIWTIPEGTKIVRL